MEAYELLARQGTGSYATVWKARRRADGCIFAIKELKTPVSTWEDVLRMKEVAVMRALGSHANVLRLHTVTRLAGKVYLVLDQCDCNVFQVMSSSRTLSSGRASFTEPEIRWLMRQVLAGLAHMHGARMMHRDVKPENILLCAVDGTAKVCDFGQARPVLGSPGSSATATRLTDYVSTRWYRAPELLLHAPTYGPQVDIWAAGCLMAECFTFRPVFPGTSEADTIFKIVSALGSPPATWREAADLASSLGIRWPETRGVGLSALIPRASAAALNLMQSMLSWDPSQRPTSMDLLRHPFFMEDGGQVSPVPILGAASMRQGEEVLARADAQAAQAAIMQALDSEHVGSAAIVPANATDSSRGEAREAKEADEDADESERKEEKTTRSMTSSSEIIGKQSDSSDEDAHPAYVARLPARKQQMAHQVPTNTGRAAVSRNPFAARLASADILGETAFSALSETLDGSYGPSDKSSAHSAAGPGGLANESSRRNPPSTAISDSEEEDVDAYVPSSAGPR